MVLGSERGAVLRADDIGPWLDKVEPGRPASVFTDDVADTHNAIEQILTSRNDPARVVTLSWLHVPPLGNELGQLVSALTQAAFKLYPFLYGLKQSPSKRWTEADVETAAHDVTRRFPGVLGSACRQILGDCHRGRLPDLGKLPNGTQVRQLALAVEPERLVILVAVHDATASKGSLRALAQGAEWLAANAEARVILVLPLAISGASELDHVTYTACLFAASEKPAGAPGPAKPVRKTKNAKASSGSAETPVVSTSPVVGDPHPGSDSEQELYRHICDDAELRLLFAYNQRITTTYGTKPVVDLLWKAGRLVIEIDGDDHRGPRMFVQDRRRDFELLMSGYRVIRFTSSNVVEHVDLVLKDIRAAVRQLGTREKDE